ncbi:hypothetical protein BH11MYX4_BH11MYX4_01810 [soil metagenome]
MSAPQKTVTQVEPYHLDPDFERAVAFRVCSVPDFYMRIGRWLEPDALGAEPAKLAVRTAQQIGKEEGRGPSSTLIVVQRLLSMMAAGKLRLEEVQDVHTLFDLADGTVDPAQLVATLAPILRRRAQSNVVMAAHDEYGKKEDFSRIAAMIKRAQRIGLADGADDDDLPVVQRAIDIEPESVRWLWLGFIPFAKITMVDGDPGLGKSTMTSADIAARVSTGAAMPGEAGTHEPGAVLIMSAEDGARDTIRPRLEAAGADLSRVHIIDPALLTLADADKLEAIIVEKGAKLLIIDPLMAFLGGRTDSHRDQDIRRAMRPLSVIAERTGCAIVLVRHLNKSGGTSAMYRGGGSIAIGGAARSVVLVAKDPDREDVRIVASVKSNLGPPPTALAFSIVSDPIHACGRVVWMGESLLTADALTASPRAGDAEETSAVGDACRVLQEVLASGPRPASEVTAEAKAAGIATMTLRRAKVRLGVRASKSTGPGGPWMWSLANQDAQGVQGAQAAQGDGEEHAPLADEAVHALPVEPVEHLDRVPEAMSRTMVGTGPEEAAQ